VHEDQTSLAFGKGKVFPRIYACVEKWMFALSQSLVVHSEAQRNRLPERTRGRARIIEFGVERRVASQEEDSRAPVVGCFGLVAPHKGIETVIEACRLASSELPGLRLIIGGTLSPAHGQYGATIRRRLVESLGDSGQLVLDAPQSQFEGLFDDVSMVCFGLRHVNQSTSFYRALAHGKPVVVTNVGGVAEVVKREGVGFVVPVDNAAAMADAMVNLLGSCANYGRARQAIERYASGQTWATSAAAYAAVYRQLIKLGTS
jgi:glycosyltransferase involved in cell wall biosynthesis